MKVVKYLFFVSIVFLTSCLTIIEKYTLNADGSGTMEYIFDMSELYEMLQMYGSDSTLEAMNANELFEENLPELEKVNGITNVRLTGDQEKYIFGLAFDFSDEESLNKAMQVLVTDETSDQPKTFISIKRKKMVRYGDIGRNLNMDEFMGGGEEDIDPEMLKEMLTGMKYKLVFKTPGKVKKVITASESEILESGEAVVTSDFYTLSKENGRMETTVKF